MRSDQSLDINQRDFSGRSYRVDIAIYGEVPKGYAHGIDTTSRCSKGVQRRPGAGAASRYESDAPDPKLIDPEHSRIH
jgi:hypothetical protein